MVNHKAQRVGKNGFVFDDDPPAHHSATTNERDVGYITEAAEEMAVAPHTKQKIQATAATAQAIRSAQRRRERWIKIARWMVIIGTVLGVVLTVLLKTMFN